MTPNNTEERVALVRRTLGNPGFMGAMLAAFAMRRLSGNDEQLREDMATACDLAKAAPGLSLALTSTDNDVSGLVGWQPIETAPKDGTRIDVWAVHTSGLGAETCQRFTNAKWYADGWRDNYGNQLEWRVDPTAIEEGYSPFEGRRVTHWMPLPAPPALAKHRQSNGGVE